MSRRAQSLVIAVPVSGTGARLSVDEGVGSGIGIDHIVGQIFRGCATLRTMRGYTANSYGDGFADVYDDWYADVTDIDATVGAMLAAAGPGATVLELGVGTGRLAIPMADAGLHVTGIDSSRAMLARLADQDPNQRVDVVVGDMVTDLPSGPFDAALVAYNTIFNLLDDGAQAACFEAVASRLSVGGRFVVEAFVPIADSSGGSDVTVRTMAVDRVVLSVSQNDPDEQRASGQFIEITEDSGVRLRPWSVRWSTPAQLDVMAARAGFVLENRWANMSGDPFDEHSAHHVSVFRLP